MQEMTCSFEIRITPRFVFVLDGSKESVKLHEVAQAIAEELDNTRLYFLGDPQEYNPRDLSASGMSKRRNWQKLYENQVRVIAPIIETLRQKGSLKEHLIILSAQPIIDLEDWIGELNCLLLGESQPLYTCKDLIEVEQHSYEDWQEALEELRGDKLEEIRIGFNGESWIPTWWDNNIFSWDENRWELYTPVDHVKQRVASIQLAAFTRSAGLPQAILKYKSGREEFLPTRTQDKFSTSTESVELTPKDVSTFEQAIAGKPFRCPKYPDCLDDHGPTDLYHKIKNNSIRVMIYESLQHWLDDGKYGFIVFQRTGKEKITARLENSIRLPEDSLLLSRKDTRPLKYRCDQQPWGVEEVDITQVYSLGNEQFAIYLDLAL